MVWYKELIFLVIISKERGQLRHLILPVFSGPIGGLSWERTGSMSIALKASLTRPCIALGFCLRRSNSPETCNTSCVGNIKIDNNYYFMFTDFVSGHLGVRFRLRWWPTSSDLSTRVGASDYSCIHNVTLLAVCVRPPRRSIIDCILLAAIGAVSCVFAYYPYPGGQVLPNLDYPLYTLGLFKLILYKKCSPA